MVIAVTSGVLATLIEEAARAHPREACGILFGIDRIEWASVCANVHPDPAGHFEIDPAALIAAHRSERLGGPRIAGYWHSHPSGGARPSPTDSANAVGDGRVWAIVARGEIAFWRDEPGGFVPLSYSACAR